VRTILITLSIINASMGLFLLGLFLIAGDTPVVVVLLGLGLLTQAGYTLAFLSGFLDGLKPWSLWALLAGQSVALVIGFVGFASSALYNVDPRNGDYEYGPLAVGALIAIQAATTLWLYGFRERSEPDEVPHLT
jgi:hypothetical protein